MLPPSPRSVRVDAVGRASLVEAYSPGARVSRSRRLRGGLGARMHLLDVLDANGVRSRVVLRAYLPGRATHTPERAEREFRTLELVRAAGIPAPSPLYLDARGMHLGEPAMLLSYLPGKPAYVAGNLPAWANELATAMARIHAVTPGLHDLSWLPANGPEELRTEIAGLKEPTSTDGDELPRLALQVLEEGSGHVESLEPCLIHADFWPGNTIWSRGRLRGVIDWSNARLGDPRRDVSQCCVDALWVNGMDATELIREAYDRTISRALPNQWFFDILVALSMLRSLEITLLGYHDAGLAFVTPQLARDRTADFLRQAIRRSASQA